MAGDRLAHAIEGIVNTYGTTVQRATEYLGYLNSIQGGIDPETGQWRDVNADDFQTWESRIYPTKTTATPIPVAAPAFKAAAVKKPLSVAALPEADPLNQRVQEERRRQAGALRMGGRSTILSAPRRRSDDEYSLQTLGGDR